MKYQNSYYIIKGYGPVIIYLLTFLKSLNTMILSIVFTGLYFTYLYTYVGIFPKCWKSLTLLPKMVHTNAAYRCKFSAVFAENMQC